MEIEYTLNQGMFHKKIPMCVREVHSKTDAFMVNDQEHYRESRVAYMVGHIDSL